MRNTKNMVVAIALLVLSAGAAQARCHVTVDTKPDKDAYMVDFGDGEHIGVDFGGRVTGEIALKFTGCRDLDVDITPVISGTASVTGASSR